MVLLFESFYIFIYSEIKIIIIVLFFMVKKWSWLHFDDIIVGISLRLLRDFLKQILQKRAFVKFVGTIVPNDQHMDNIPLCFNKLACFKRHRYVNMFFDLLHNLGIKYFLLFHSDLFSSCNLILLQICSTVVTVV